MKKSLILLVFLVLSSIALAQEEQGVTLNVVLENVLNDQGKVLAGLYTEAKFMRGEGLDSFASEAKAGEVSFQFKNVLPGTYAIMVLHDMNENNRMDYQDSGIPDEPYGLSNNPMRMGPPTFTDAKFEVTNEDLEIRIRF